MDGSAVQSACCSCKGLAFNSQNPHGCTQPPVALIPGDLLLNSPGYTRHAHGVIHVCRQTFGHIELSNLERIIEAERCLSVIIPLESLLAAVIFISSLFPTCQLSFHPRTRQHPLKLVETLENNFITWTLKRSQILRAEVPTGR